MGKPTDYQRRAFDAWLAQRPASVQEKARAYPPWDLYELRTTGQHCHIISYSESHDGSCETCCIVAWMPWFPLPTGVFGIQYRDLRALSDEEAEESRRSGILEFNTAFDDDPEAPRP